LNRAAAPLVPLGLAYRFALPFADLTHAVWRSKRDIARRNYAHILGRDAGHSLVQWTAHACFQHFSRYITEMLDVQGWDTRSLADRLKIEGEDYFAEAEAHGRGIIFVSAHMGSAEVAAAIAILRGYKITAVTEQLRPKFVMDWAVACRARMGVTLLLAGGAGIKLLRALRKKEMVAFAIDAGIDKGGGVTADFFGRDTVFPVGPARLARLSGAPIVFAVAVREPGARFFAYVEPPIVSDRELGAEEDARQLTQRLASTLERYVRRYPEQWYAFREMWPNP
jgi:KDO2-lipid IV(A) lauroyltransferase